MRSKLFVPASRPELFAKAMKGEADMLSFDLEDAVDETMKDEARKELRKYLSTLPVNSGKTIIVRVNGLSSGHFEADLKAIVGPAVDMVNLPKCESAADVRACAGALAKLERKARMEPTGILVNIESPKALRFAAEMAGASPRVQGLQVGYGDLIEPLNIDRYNARVIETIQLQVRIAAGEAGVWAYDGAYANIKDANGYREEAERARRLGFIGKSCIHPSQVPLANAVFRPSDEEIAHSLRVVQAARTAAERGVGAFTVDGRMIDAPFIRRAEQILAMARKLGLVAAEERTIQ
ncbi:MAG: HpcH/HpaI aldolase/citrate lyase family protein [Bacillota bacterium]